MSRSDDVSKADGDTQHPRVDQDRVVRAPALVFRGQRLMPCFRQLERVDCGHATDIPRKAQPSIVVQHGVVPRTCHPRADSQSSQVETCFALKRTVATAPSSRLRS